MGALLARYLPSAEISFELPLRHRSLPAGSDADSIAEHRGVFYEHSARFLPHLLRRRLPRRVGIPPNDHVVEVDQCPSRRPSEHACSGTPTSRRRLLLRADLANYG